MGYKRKSDLNKKRKITAAVLVFLVICIFVAMATFQYYYQVETSVKWETQSFLKEISTQMGQGISKNVNGNFSAVETIAKSLELSEFENLEHYKKSLSEFQKSWGFESIFLINSDGEAFDADGKQVRLTSDEYLQEVIVDGKTRVSTFEIIDGKECVIFVTPMKTVFGEFETSALGITFSLASFDKNLKMDFFDGAGFAHIIRNDGTVVIPSSSEKAFEIGYNLLNTLEYAEFAKGSSLEEFRQGVQRSASGFSEITFNEERLYMSFSKIKINHEDDWNLIVFVPVSIVNAKSIMMLKLTLLLCGGVTLAFGIFGGLFISSFLKSKRKLEILAYVDQVTNGNTFQFFQIRANEILTRKEEGEMALVYTNIEKFKILNEQFTRRRCDDLLREIYNTINADLQEDECIGRISADNFVILLHYQTYEEIVQRIVKWKGVFDGEKRVAKDVNIPFFINFGVYPISDLSKNLSYMIDRAKLSLGSFKPIIYDDARITIYNDEIGRTLLREKEMEDRMESAMRNGEFQVYLQPKFSSKFEKIMGAEALVRWVTPAGIIPPGQFIPLFEKNGFVCKLDLHVFEIVCKTLKKWKEERRTLLKISVNCSRNHLREELFWKKYVDIAEKYGIDPGFVEIEFTESVVFEDIDFFSGVVTKIKEEGFSCSIDDFGSGYSSLGVIQDLPVDTIKFDGVFFQSRTKEGNAKTKAVVESMINLSKNLSLTTVAEGVETREHVDMLKDLECDLIQGYYFAKPMPIGEFEENYCNFEKGVNEE